ncbi:MAG: mannose-1-phosphate guanylyltransferase/mannose-6-phosphate isomerase [Burkholderiales bacterium]
MTTKLIPTILCGGAGSRLWPVSRELHPKPFITLGDGESLLQKAFIRGSTLPEVAEVMTVTNRDLLFQTQDQYRVVNERQLPLSFLLEPVGRNTAAAIAAAALHAEVRHGGDAVMLVLAADHLILNQDSFAQAVTQAVKLAGQGNIVTFGITPTSPETGYGYIEADGNAVLRFVEKPNRPTAEAYLRDGGYLWNSGMFCFGAEALLREMESTCPDVLNAVKLCLAQSREVAGVGVCQVELAAETFSLVPDISFDYAVMERTKRAAVVPCDIGWSDIGSWNALSELVQPDGNGNRVEGEAVMHDATNCFVRSGERMVGVVGLDGVLVIDTTDAVLVAHKDRAQDVKQVFATLKSSGHESHKLHRTVHRPWGTYTVLEEGDGYKMKRIEVKPGASLSLQMHHHRGEHWIVVRGVADVVNGESELKLQANESTFIPAGSKHRLANLGKEALVLIEVQTGGYLGEDDIVRFHDVYGRVSGVRAG